MRKPSLHTVIGTLLLVGAMAPLALLIASNVACTDNPISNMIYMLLFLAAAISGLTVLLEKRI